MDFIIIVCAEAESSKEHWAVIGCLPVEPFAVIWNKKDRKLWEKVPKIEFWLLTNYLKNYKNYQKKKTKCFKSLVFSYIHI